MGRRDERPLRNILAVEIFDMWGIDFIRLFPPPFGPLYILLVIDYVSKWMEAIGYPRNDATIVVNFIQKHIFTRFGAPTVMISDEGTHFLNRVLLIT